MIGYDFDEGCSNLEEKLMKDILKEDAEPMGRVKIVWKKGATDNKKSIVILDANNRWARENILRNQKAGKDFIVKKSILKRFRDAENELKKKARTVRVINMNGIKTEVEIWGIRCVSSLKRRTQ